MLIFLVHLHLCWQKLDDLDVFLQLLVLYQALGGGILQQGLDGGEHVVGDI